mmetsp:Transcript_30530/g.58792  ORF Transcript_30530/g.58792 Transcript_30530/m.58792 type:complete len:481 (+) Transcript_30530:314-1756(+)
MSSFLTGGRRNKNKSDSANVNQRRDEGDGSTASSLKNRFFGSNNKAKNSGGVVGSDSEDSDFSTEELQDDRPASRAARAPPKPKPKATGGDFHRTALSSGYHVSKSSYSATTRQHNLEKVLKEEEEIQEVEDVGGWAAPPSRWGQSQSHSQAGTSQFVVHGNPAFDTGGASSSRGQSFRQAVNGGGGEFGDSSDEEIVVARKQTGHGVTNRGLNIRTPHLSNSAERAQYIGSPSAHDTLTHCYVKREKDKSGMYPQFRMYLSEGDQFLLAARRRKKSQTTNYLISLDMDDLQRKGASFYGKLRGNYVGTQYILYNSGLKPGRNVSKVEERKEMGAIMFKPTALDIKGGPRMMTVVVPFPESFNERLGLDDNDPGLCKRWKQQKKGKGAVTTIALQNKRPVWDPQSKGYCLDFRGRVTAPSVKNFQLVTCNANGDAGSRVVLQFGKCGDDSFVLDFCHPLTPFQAFGICLSSVDGKLCYSI